MKRNMILAVGLALVAPHLSRAAIEAKIIYMNSDTNVLTNIQSYTVPTNKVLAIENIVTTDRDKVILFINTNDVVEFDMKLKRNETFEEVVNLQPSLKVPGGWTITLEPDADMACAIFGLLVDPEDLYASIPNNADRMALTTPGTLLQTTYRLDAPRQALVKFEESTDLAAWTENTGISSTMGAARDEHTFTIDPNLDQAFQRAAFRSRRGSSGMPH